MDDIRLTLMGRDQFRGGECAVAGNCLLLEREIQTSWNPESSNK